MKYVSTVVFIIFFGMVTLSYAVTMGSNVEKVGDIKSALEDGERNVGISFEVRVFKYPEGSKIFKGSTLKSGDAYKIEFKPSKNCYVYIYAFDSNENFSDLIKQSGGFHNYVEKGKSYIFPLSDEAIVLDNNTGIETIYFLAFSKKKSTLTKYYEDIYFGRNLDKIATNHFGSSVKKINENNFKNTKIECKNGCVYKLTFKHE